MVNSCCYARQYAGLRSLVNNVDLSSGLLRIHVRIRQYIYLGARFRGAAIEVFLADVRMCSHHLQQSSKLSIVYDPCIW